jgi:hypothetical protein
VYFPGDDIKSGAHSRAGQQGCGSQCALSPDTCKVNAQTPFRAVFSHKALLLKNRDDFEAISP